jgi:hypothetical protein
VIVFQFLDLQSPVQSVYDTTLVVNEFESAYGEGYSIKYYLRQVGGFLQVLRFPPLIKLTATI